MRIYGGFAGNETTRADRNPSTFQTTLSGEIGNPGTEDNVFHVVWASDTNITALLDGLTITGGRADGLGSPWNEGGGLYAYSGDATVVNVTFSGNYATQAGGGIATNGGVVHVYNSRFFGNQAGVLGWWLLWPDQRGNTGELRIQRQFGWATRRCDLHGLIR